MVSLLFVASSAAILVRFLLLELFFLPPILCTDNIAPPIASCLGDLVTLSLLGAVSAALINFVNTPIPFIIVVLVILSSITCALFTRRNSFVKDMLTQGWSPLFGAMVISSGTGLVLDHFATRYQGFPLLAVVCGGLYSISLILLCLILTSSILFRSSRRRWIDFRIPTIYCFAFVRTEVANWLEGFAGP